MRERRFREAGDLPRRGRLPAGRWLLCGAPGATRVSPQCPHLWVPRSVRGLDSHPKDKATTQGDNEGRWPGALWGGPQVGCDSPQEEGDARLLPPPPSRAWGLPLAAWRSWPRPEVTKAGAPVRGRVTSPLTQGVRKRLEWALGSEDPGASSRLLENHAGLGACFPVHTGATRLCSSDPWLLLSTPNAATASRGSSLLPESEAASNRLGGFPTICPETGWRAVPEGCCWAALWCPEGMLDRLPGPAAVWCELITGVPSVGPGDHRADGQVAPVSLLDAAYRAGLQGRPGQRQRQLPSVQGAAGARGQVWRPRLGLSPPGDPADCRCVEEDVETGSRHQMPGGGGAAGRL